MNDGLQMQLKLLGNDLENNMSSAAYTYSSA